MMRRVALVAAGIVFSAVLAGTSRGAEPAGKVEFVSPELKRLVPDDAVIEKLAGGFKFTEGPVWTREGYLLFSDIPNDAIVKWDPKSGQVSDYRKPSAGANGNTLDSQGRLVSCEHAGRRVSRREKDGTVVTVADRYDGKRLNSPNDVIFKSDGALYFTDPPYGLAKQDEDPAKEQTFNGVYRVKNGKVTLLATDLKRPNGLAFSPDEKTLYVANSDADRKLWMAYPVKADGTLGPGKVFFDVTSSKEPGLPDGMKVDRRGNLYCTAPGGIWIFSPAGKHLGTLKPTEVPANCHWGDDGKTLYMTAQTGLYRIRLNVAGIRP
jgi:gluconolactonase